MMNLSLLGRSLALTFPFSLFVLLTSCSHSAKTATSSNCIQKLGSLDIGSGSTKALVAEVDVCEKKFVRVIFQGQEAIGFSETLERSPTNELPPEVIAEGSTKIRTLMFMMREQQASRISALATSAFRVAKNGAAAAAELARNIGIPVRVVTQDEEAQIGYLSAIALLPSTPVDSKPIVVWDIGGGSMQIRTQNSLQQPQTFKGSLASVSFKNQVIQNVQHKDFEKNSTPNPLGNARVQAVTLARRHARENIPPVFKELATTGRWVGIGGVLALSVQNQVNREARQFTQSELATTLRKRSLLKDEDIGGEFRTTEVTNLALVLGYMEGLGVEKTETVRATLNHGFLLYLLEPHSQETASSF